MALLKKIVGTAKSRQQSWNKWGKKAVIGGAILGAGALALATGGAAAAGAAPAVSKLAKSVKASAATKTPDKKGGLLTKIATFAKSKVSKKVGDMAKTSPEEKNARLKAIAGTGLEAAYNKAQDLGIIKGEDTMVIDDPKLKQTKAGAGIIGVIIFIGLLLGFIFAGKKNREQYNPKNYKRRF